MNSPVLDVRKERKELERFAVFNRRFRAVYGWPALAAIAVVALIVLVFGVWWLDPLRVGYTPDEQRKIWLGVAVMPFAAVIAGSFVVEFLVKGVHVGLWAVRRTLRVSWPARIVGYLAGTLLVLGGACTAAGGDFDVWGLLWLTLGVLVAHCFICWTWDASVEAQ